MKKLWLGTLLVAVGLAGCGGDDDGQGPTAPLSDAGASAGSGTYALTTTVDLPINVLAPQPAVDAFATLRGLRQDPARTLFDLAEQAGVPHAQALHQAVPDLLQSRLDGWIDDFVWHAAFGGKPVPNELDRLLDAGSRLETQVDLLSDLTLGPPDVRGTCAGTHALRAVHLTAFPELGAFTIPTLPAPTGMTEVPLEVRLSAPRAGSDARVTASDHAFGLPIGQYMVRVLDTSLEQRYGHDLRGTFALMIDCPALAASVSHECVGPVCVGHQSELEEVCERGLDEAAAQVRDRLLEHDFKAVHFATGTADFTAPARLDSGVWKASVNVGTGERTVTARFTGARR